MKEKITDRKKDPLGNMMLDYQNGRENALVKVWSSTLEMWEMKGETMFRTFKSMNRIERKALSLCKGYILDIGAGSGCHALYLQKKQKKVQAIDISPGCVDVMKKTGVMHAEHTNLFSLNGQQKFDTLLMLMNGIGICGSIDGLNLFLQFIQTILNPGGQLIVDSTDLSVLYDLALLSSNNETYHGETLFTMAYKKNQSDPFKWLYVDFSTLQYYADFHGFACEKILQDKTGKYLARITYI